MSRPVALILLVAVGIIPACSATTTRTATTAAVRAPPTTVEAIATTPPPVTTTTSTTTSTSTTTTMPTTTTSTTTSTTTTTTTTTVATLSAVESVLITGDDPEMPVSLLLPRAPGRPFFDDVVESWATAARSSFTPRARSVLQARAAAEAAEAAARAAAEAAAATTVGSAPTTATTTTTTTTTTTVPDPPPPPPQLTVEHDAVERVGTASLVRLRSTVVLDTSPETETAVFYAFDSGPILPAIALVDPARVGDLIALVGGQLGDRVGDWRGVQPRQLLTDIILDPGGALRLTVPTRYLAPGDAGEPIAIDPTTALPLLSAAGQAILTGDPFAAPADGVDCELVACVALTFDDGPSQHTPRLLDVLDRAGAPASFFVLGSAAERHPEVLARMAAEGHAIGNHSWSHNDFRRLSAVAQADDVALTDAVIAAASGTVPTMLRPPYGKRNADTLWLGYTIALWDVDSRDWQHRNPDRTVFTVMAQIDAGSVVLLHDLHGTSVDTVALLIVELRAAGYHLVTLPHLLGDPEPGAVYRSATEFDPPPPPTTTTTTTTTTTVPITTEAP